MFPKLIADQFPEFSTIQVGQAAVSLAFLGALVGSLARPYGGKLADRFGGARVTVGAFAVMALGALALIWTMSMQSFWVFLGCFLLLFAATGVGNGSTYRMIPSIFAARGLATDALPGTPEGIRVQRKAAAALGLISAIGAYGGFLVPQVLNVSQQATGGYTAAFYGFVGAYVAPHDPDRPRLRRAASLAGRAADLSPMTHSPRSASSSSASAPSAPASPRSCSPPSRAARSR